MPGGRPLKFKTVEELDRKIEEYFDVAEVPTISGLAVHLGTWRSVICGYAERDEYSNSIKMAKARCEAFAETGMMAGKLNATGCIFSLKNNYGWKDKTEQDVKVSGSVADAIRNSGRKVDDSTNS